MHLLVLFLKSKLKETLSKVKHLFSFKLLPFRPTWHHLHLVFATICIFIIPRCVCVLVHFHRVININKYIINVDICGRARLLLSAHLVVEFLKLSLKEPCNQC